MEPTVLAGPVEFSAAEIAAIVAVLVALSVAVTAPGWAAVGWAFRRRRLARGPGRAWPAAVGGCLTGLALSAGVSFVAGAVLQPLAFSAVALTVLVCWAACWGLAAFLTRGLGSAAELPPSSAEPKGWGG